MKGMGAYTACTLRHSAFLPPCIRTSTGRTLIDIATLPREAPGFLR